MPRGNRRQMCGPCAKLVLVASCVLASRSAWAQAPGVEPPRPSEQVVPIVAKESRVSLIELQTRILELNTKIRSVDGHDPDILTIIPVSNHRLRLKAEKSGVTAFTLTDEFDNVYNIEVFVDADVRELQAYLGRLFPGAAIEVVGLNGSVVLRGWVTEPQQINMITDVAEKFSANVLNQMSVAGVSQIQLQVKVMEVQRSKLRQFGFNFLHVGQNGYFASTPGNLTPISPLTGGVGGNSGSFPFGGPPGVQINPANVTTATAQFAITGASNVFQSFIEAVEANSMAKVLADTALVVNSGRPATLLAGGSFPVLVPQPGAGTTTFTIQYKDFGVRLEAVAIVLGNGKLRLQVAPEVSERDASSAVVIAGTSVPGLTLRRVNTEVEMRFGETLMLGGLILQREVETRSNIPFLGDLPWIGSAFSRRKSEVGETELLIMLTPHMAAPISAGQLSITGPGTNTEPAASHEFYFDGHVEVPNYNNDWDPIGGSFDPMGVPVESMPPTISPTEPPPSQSIPQQPPTVVPETPTSGSVTQTSGVQETKPRPRGTLLGTMRSFRVDRDKEPIAPATNNAVRSNAGNQVRTENPSPTESARANSAPETTRERIRLVEQPVGSGL